MKALFIAGGAGTRLWPLSRNERPKQFHALAGESSLLAQSIERVRPLVRAEDTWVVTAARHVEMTAAHAADVPPGQIIGEPFPIGTNLAVGLGALHIARQDPEATLFVGWADSFVGNEEEYLRALRLAEDVARASSGVILGVRPHFPATGYGYIRAGSGLTGHDGAFHIDGFEEKPTAERAEEFLAEGGYYWNPGMSVWVVSRLLEQIRLHKPEHYDALTKIDSVIGTPHEREATAEALRGLDPEPIDTAVFERAEGLAVVPADLRWSDVGSWDAVYELSAPEPGANASSGEVVAVDTSGCLIHGSDRLIATLGVSDLIIIDAGDCLLVAHKGQAARLKELHTAVVRANRGDLT
ncbi:MAG TPA: sugar phosphate nucleotidyltransferase [Pyrinomonadaceae bacterium]|nr:sugar phosphate nucleotidyltransferase [Pyrinomonadaceae bacterium]